MRIIEAAAASTTKKLEHGGSISKPSAKAQPQISKCPSVCMKFFRKNGEPAINTNNGVCASSKPKVIRNSLAKSSAVTSKIEPPSANTSHTGTVCENSATAAPT